MEPQSLDEVRPGCYDVHERVKDMDAGGVLASMNFPSFPTFTARVFETDDLDLSRALVRAYNDWHIDEWCGAYPARFIPMAVPMMWDPEETAAEVRRNAAKGCHSLSFTENPAALGRPSFHDEHWDPLWQACVRHRHRAVDPPRLVGPAVDPGRRLAARRDDHAAADEHPVRRRRPALVAGDQDSSPTCASRCPRAAPAGSPTSSTASTAPTRCTGPGRSRTSAAASPARCSASTSSPASSATRSASRCATTSASTTCAGRPTTPTATRCGRPPPRSCDAVFAANDVPDDEVRKMSHENAMRWYSFDPFTHMPKEDATVGALRRKAAGHDVADHLAQHPGAHPRREARGLPPPRPPRRRRELTRPTCSGSGSSSGRPATSGPGRCEASSSTRDLELVGVHVYGAGQGRRSTPASSAGCRPRASRPPSSIDDVLALRTGLRPLHAAGPRPRRRLRAARAPAATSSPPAASSTGRPAWSRPMRERVEAACAAGADVDPQHRQQPGVHHRGAPARASPRSSAGSTGSPSRSSPTCRSAPPPSSSSTSWASAEPPEPEADPRRLAHLQASFGPSLELLAEALGLPLDGLETTGDVAVATQRTEIAAGTLEAGTRRRPAHHGLGPTRRQDAPALHAPPGTAPRTSTPTGTSATPAGASPSTATRRLHIELCASPSRSSAWPRPAPGYTANRAVNAVPVVCAAEPGIRTTVDLPQVIAALG